MSLRYSSATGSYVERRSPTLPTERSERHRVWSISLIVLVPAYIT